MSKRTLELAKKKVKQCLESTIAEICGLLDDVEKDARQEGYDEGYNQAQEEFEQDKANITTDDEK